MIEHLATCPAGDDCECAAGPPRWAWGRILTAVLGVAALVVWAVCR